MVVGTTLASCDCPMVSRYLLLAFFVFYFYINLLPKPVGSKVNVSSPIGKALSAILCSFFLIYKRHLFQIKLLPMQHEGISLVSARLAVAFSLVFIK